MQKFISKNKIALTILIVFILGITFFNLSVASKHNTTPINTENTQSAILLVGDMTDHLSFLPNTVLYDALMQAKNAGKIGFSGKNYLGLGFFVTDIGTLHTGNGKNLIYYINGKEANVGVSSYILKNGDIIEWKLE